MFSPLEDSVQGPTRRSETKARRPEVQTCEAWTCPKLAKRAWGSFLACHKQHLQDFETPQLETSRKNQPGMDLPRSNNFLNILTTFCSISVEQVSNRVQSLVTRGSQNHTSCLSRQEQELFKRFATTWRSKRR